MRRLGLALAGVLLAASFVAVYDAVLLMTAWQRLGRAAAGLSATLAAGGLPDPDALARDFAYAGLLAHPDDVTDRGGIVVTAFAPGGSAGGPAGAIAWRRQIGRPGASRYGASGGPAHAIVAGHGMLIAAELAAPISPWVVGGALLRVRLHAHAEARSDVPP